MDGRLASSVVAAQTEHAAYGGVVPEVASRAHQALVVPVVARALAEAGVGPSDLTAVAATYGPGLAGALLVGLSFAKAYALALGLPFVGVNHLDGHLYSVFLGEDGPDFPFLALTASGGHTNLVLVEEGFHHTVLGTTRDDAAGEAFDKVGKLLGLPYPGGPHVDRLAADGDARFVRFPRTRLPGYDFSFSGVKTAVRYALDPVTPPSSRNGAPALPGRDVLLRDHLADLCASFQAAAVDMLVEPLERALVATDVRAVALVGGVSANRGLRAAAGAACARHGARLFVPEPRFCTDNAAMIALAAHHRLAGTGPGSGPSPLSLGAAPALRADAPAPALVPGL